MKKNIVIICLVFLLFNFHQGAAQLPQQNKLFTHQDSLRGSVTPQRAWWDVLYYNLSVTPDYKTKTIIGKNTMTYYDSGTGHTMQIDLQQPLQLDSAVLDNRSIRYSREGNVYWLYIRDSLAKYKIKPGPQTITLYYHGQPKEATRPPWDGGWIWTKDAKGRPWMSVACQGLGASVWYPCKDYQGDEPDNGATLTIRVPDSLMAIGNGRLKNKTVSKGIATYSWEVKSPINNYDIIPYIGYYVNWKETYKGEKGDLDCSYWVLDYDLQKAKEQFKQVPLMLKAFEYWFGPYPFYDDGYKLVAAPHLGMEHQSNVAYGNHYMNGYLGRDLSGTGWGLKWDYIIVHESGHEWFGNNITTKDIADMWVHEGFTDYSETLYIDYYYGKKAADTYLQGLRKNITNDRPIIGPYGVNEEGSTDMYYKGANMIHTIRQVINNDSLFRSILRGLNQTFYHQTVTSAQVEQYISQQSGKDLSTVFDQYLRTNKIPTLLVKASDKQYQYQWTNVLPHFNMPVQLTNGDWLQPETAPKSGVLHSAAANTLSVNKNFYIKVDQ